MKNATTAQSHQTHTFNVGERVRAAGLAMTGKIVGFTHKNKSVATVRFGFGDQLWHVSNLRPADKEKPMPTSVTITAERIIEAAKTCPDAEKVLRTLAPEVFKDVDLEGADLGDFMCVREFGSRRYKSFYLDPAYAWSIETDDEDVQCLVPRRK